MSAQSTLDRRAFLKTGAAAGGGLVIAFYVPVLSAHEQKPKPEPMAPFAYIKIASEEKVTIVANHSEMGQGVYTSLPMLLNEELEADWSKIRVEAAPVDKAYNHPVFGMQMTGGSTTSPAEWERYRKMGATARVMLVQAAATKWGVEASTCKVEKGYVVHAATNKRATYGSL